jgi:hypothetical protein
MQTALIRTDKRPKICAVSFYFITDPRTCKLQEVKKQGFVLSHNAAYCHLIASGCSVTGIK